MTGQIEREARVRRAYRTFLRAYPASFRAEYGQDIEETFVDRYRDAMANGRGVARRFFVRAMLDAILSGARERAASLSHRADMLYWQDVRYALRLLARSPLFTLLTVVVLSGGLALSIFTFTFLHTAMLRPLPLGGGDRIVRVDQRIGDASQPIDVADLALMRPAIRTLSDVGAFSSRQLILGTDGERRVIGATAAEWNIFEVTRTPPALGRTFRPDDQLVGAEPVIVLGHRTWQVAFGGDSSVVGRTVILNGTPTRVIGVMPAGYGFPVAAESWVPLGADVLATTVPGKQAVDVYARLAPDATVESAHRELETLLARARRTHPADGKDAAPVSIAVQSFPMAQIGEEGPLALTVLNALAALILLLACINVSNLLLARANERARETAVRLALGASRPRLVMQSLWESVLLCVAGGVLATVLAAWGLTSINRWAHANLEGNLAFWWVWELDRTGLVAAGAFVTLTIAVLGGVVSARAADTEFHAVLRDGGARSGGRREGRVAGALVATQVATVSVLMFFGVMSGIVAHRVATVDLGYDTHDLLTTAIAPAADRFATWQERNAFYMNVYDGLTHSSALDGVVMRAGLGEIGSASGELEIGDARLAPDAPRPRAYVQATLGSLATLGVRLRAGRETDATDRSGTVPVAVVSQAFAERHWPRATALGQRVRLTGAGEHAEWRTVVGVVSDVLLGNALSRDRSAQAVYVPLGQTAAVDATIVFRHRDDAAAAQAALYQTLASVDPLLPPPAVSTFDEMLGKTALIARSVAKLFALCFGFALVLAVSGTYGLMARSIGRRTREIGLRRALGATDGVIVRTLLGQGGRQLGVGAVVALPFMLLVGVGFSHFFPIGVALSLATGFGVASTIVAIVLVATYAPTRTAMSIAPRDALWRE